MTIGLILLSVAGAAAIAFGVSLCVFVVSRAFEGALDAISPRAQARLLLCKALLPLLATLALMTAAMAPAFGWIVDHCTVPGDFHHEHPHLCGDHGVVGLPGISVIALAGLFSLRLFFAGSLVVWRVWLARTVRVTLEAASCSDASAGIRVLPIAEPQAFVLGLTRSKVYVTRGLLAEEHREHLEAVLAHEQAHVLRRDPFKRLLAQIGLIFHLPGVARWLERRLARAQEMAADSDAAGRVGSGDRIALALVHLARARARFPHLVLAFGTSDLESRVRRLLLQRREVDFPRAGALLVALGCFLAVIATFAGTVHHGVEMLLGLFGS